MNRKPLEKVSDLKRGDIVYHRASDKAYVVNAVYGDRATATMTADITNPVEWEVLTPNPHG